MKRPAKILLIALVAIAACKTTKFEVKDGGTARNLLLFNKSPEFLVKEYNDEKDPRKQQQIAYNLGDSYEKYHDLENAEKWFKQSFDLTGDEQSLLRLAFVQKQEEKYEAAIKSFEQYQRISSNGGFEGRRQANQCREALEWKKEFTKTQVTNLESLNSPASDYALEPFKNGQFVFTSSRDQALGTDRDGWTGEKFEDLFTTEKKDGNYTAPANFGAPVNSIGHESSPTFSANFKEMYFVRCTKDPEHSNQYCHIYYTAYNNEHWDEPVKLDLFADTVNVYDPFLTKDGKTLLVAANPKDDFGMADIYMLTKTDSGWGAPKNMGGVINTPGNERFPWLDERGNLYYSSSGLPGMGGLDIFKCVKTKTGYRDPVNLKAPINSGADDFAYRIEKYKPANDEDTVLFAGYFSSNRAGGKGSDDLYRFEDKWINVFVLNGQTVEKNFATPNEPKSQLLGLKPLSRAKVELKTPDDHPVGAMYSDTTGNFYFKLNAETDYKLVAGKTGYFNKVQTISTKGLRNRDSTIIHLYAQLELEKYFEKTFVEIPNIYYDYDSTKLRPESKLVLDTVYQFFKENPDLVIEIGSHTDSRGSDDYNMKLSQGRAQSVVDYLVAKGIPAGQLKAKGYGETMPVNKCINGVKCTEEEYQKNRRTTFRVLSAKLNIESQEPGNIKLDPKKDGQ